LFFIARIAIDHERFLSLTRVARVLRRRRRLDRWLGRPDCRVGDWRLV